MSQKSCYFHYKAIQYFYFSCTEVTIDYYHGSAPKLRNICRRSFHTTVGKLI